jgi:HPt (histidine-containing phosphotransfer) domain-containing protein
MTAPLPEALPQPPKPAPQGLSILIAVAAPDVAASLSQMLEPFGNRVLIAAGAADAAGRAGRENFDVLIAGPDEADLLAAAPGVKAPILALLLRGDRTPDAAAGLLRWPATGDALFQALEMVGAPTRNAEDDDRLAAAIDPLTFSTLEKSVGVKTLIEILQCYEATAEQLTNALAEACAQERWDDAARLAQDIVGAAGGLGLTAMTQAARQFARANRAGEDAHALRNAAQLVVGEHQRARRALGNLYPDLR